jgi:hypothetical protein
MMLTRDILQPIATVLLILTSGFGLFLLLAITAVSFADGTFTAWDILLPLGDLVNIACLAVILSNTYSRSRKGDFGAGYWLPLVVTVVFTVLLDAGLFLAWRR